MLLCEICVGESRMPTSTSREAWLECSAKQDRINLVVGVLHPGLRFDGSDSSRMTPNNRLGFRRRVPCTGDIWAKVCSFQLFMDMQTPLLNFSKQELP